MAKLADALDLGSSGPKALGGSTPPSRTTAQLAPYAPSRAGTLTWPLVPLCGKSGDLCGLSKTRLDPSQRRSLSVLPFDQVMWPVIDLATFRGVPAFSRSRAPSRCGSTRDAGRCSANTRHATSGPADRSSPDSVG